MFPLIMYAFFFVAKMDFKSFMMEGIDSQFHFLTREDIINEGGGSPSVFVNNETPSTYVEPLHTVAPSQFTENMTDSDDTSSEKDEVVLIGCSVAEKSKIQRVSVPSKVIGKRKQDDSRSLGRETGQKTRKVPPQVSKAAGEPFDPLDVDSDPYIHEFPSAKELKDSADCHWVVAHVTPHLWKHNLKEINIEKLCDIHDKAYIRQVVLDNVMNKQNRELMSTFSEARVACDVIRETEKEKYKAYAKLDTKCNDALQDLEKNPLVLDLRVEIETLQGQVEKLHSEYSRLVLEDKNGLTMIRHSLSFFPRVAVVPKVVPHIAMKLVYSDEMGILVARLVKKAIIHGRYTAFKEVTDQKEPFELEKMSGYSPLSKKELNQASDNVATASYPFLGKATADPYAPLEVLLSKKPKSLRAKSAPSHSQSKSKPSSSKTRNPDN
ncbi:hypothetical protein Tco_0077791 [Tanacetum coccineum]